MWLAGSAMLILAAGYLLAVVVAGKIRAGREKDSAPRRETDRTGDRT